MGGGGDVWCRGVCICVMRGGHEVGCSMYSIYSCDVCGWRGDGYREVNMFSIYIMYSVCEL
jgi:hypothetical protein